VAVSSDCNGRYCYLDPYVGAQIAFAEAARNVACSGGYPAAITDCLNFGNPEKPEVFWTFYEAIRGLSDACRAFGVPVISGNVSFYNESFGSPIYPTPTVGMVGVMEDVSKHCTVAFKNEGDVIFLLGETENEIGGSEYLKLAHGVVSGRPPALDLELEKAVQATVLAAIDAGIARSAHDCSEGGLAVTLAECCMAGDLGADIHLDDGLPAYASLFSETQSRIVVTTAPEDAERLVELALANAIPYSVIGTVGGDRFAVEDKVGVTLVQLREAWEPALERALAGK
jgi:phosphoribosylformylglycinamidine synthase